MHELYELKETLMDELEQFAQKGDISAKDLEVVDKLTHTVKNLCKIIDEYEKEDGYSMAGGNRGGSYAMENRGGSYAGGSYARGNRGGGSYARGRGSNARRDSRGRYSNEGYSRNEQMISQLQEMMEDAPDDRTRSELQRFITKMESM